MEDRKLYYLQQFLERRNAMSLDYYLFTIRQLADKARKCYEEPINLEEDKFVEMLLLDGCFIIECLNSCQNESIQIAIDVRRDLLLMENQLPFFVLSQLSPDTDILSSASRLFEGLFQLKDLETTQEIRVSHIDHLLGLLHYCLWLPKTQEESTGRFPWRSINSASELQEAGVQFKGNNAVIKFEKGVLEIPQFLIVSTTECFFRNLIAYELCDPKRRHGMFFSDYIKFMDYLINSPRDVELLRRQEIIENRVGHDETICHLINNISKELILHPPTFSYSTVSNQLNKHCKKRRHLWMATLRWNYFNSPWALGSFVATVVALSLTIAQTIFSGLSCAG
ncbi:hypothetical protein NMG60_11017619 [Bertholletia excelsa]